MTVASHPGPDARGTHASEKRKKADAEKDEVNERKVRLVAPAAEPPVLFEHSARKGGRELVATAATRSRLWRETRRRERAWAIRPYGREMTLGAVASRVPADGAVDLPRSPRALRYALGGVGRTRVQRHFNMS